MTTIKKRIPAIMAVAAISLVACQTTPPAPSPPSAATQAAIQDYHCPQNEEQSDPPHLAAERDFINTLQHEIDEYVVYPELAKSNGQAGLVELCVNVLRNGEFRYSMMKQSSGYALLDGESLYAVGTAQLDLARRNSLVSIPDSVATGESDVWFEVPIDFKRKDGEAPQPLTSHETEAELSDEKWADAMQYFKSPEGQATELLINDRISKELRHLPYRLVAEGHVVANLTVNRQGQLFDVQIVRGSGISIFDGTVLLALGLMSMHPEPIPIPEAVPGNKWRMQIPINFELDDHSAR